MSDTSTTPAEKPVNDGGGNAPQDPQPTEQQAGTQASPESGSD